MERLFQNLDEEKMIRAYSLLCELAGEQFDVEVVSEIEKNTGDDTAPV